MEIATLNINTTFNDLDDLENYSRDSVDAYYEHQKIFDILFVKEDYKEMLSNTWKKTRKDWILNTNEEYLNFQEKIWKKLNFHFDNLNYIQSNDWFNIRELIIDEGFIYKNSVISNKKQLMNNLHNIFKIKVLVSKLKSFIDKDSKIKLDDNLKERLLALIHSTNRYSLPLIKVLEKIKKRYKKDDYIVEVCDKFAKFEQYDYFHSYNKIFETDEFNYLKAYTKYHTNSVFESICELLSLDNLLRFTYEQKYKNSFANNFRKDTLKTYDINCLESEMKRYILYYQNENYDDKGDIFNWFDNETFFKNYKLNDTELTIDEMLDC